MVSYKLNIYIYIYIYMHFTLGFKVMHFNAWEWSAWLKHVAYIDETNQTLLWLVAVHISVLLYPFVCIHNLELLNRFHEIQYQRIVWNIVDLFRFLLRSDSCNNYRAWRPTCAKECLHPFAARVQFLSCFVRLY